MNIRYRTATADDLPAIDALYRESFTATFGHLYSAENYDAFMAQFTPEAWQAEFDRLGASFRLAEDDAGVLGYCWVGPVTLPVPPGPDSIELHQLYLTERAKGSGVAQSLMDWALATARKTEAARVVLSVYVDNYRAQRFYARYGFREIGKYEFRVGDQIDDDRIWALDL